VIGAWALVVPAFRHAFGVDLDAARHTVSWKWFARHTAYLLEQDNPLARHFGYRSRLERLLEAVYLRPEE
jgi:hypothetical protein